VFEFVFSPLRQWLSTTKAEYNQTKQNEKRKKEKQTQNTRIGADVPGGRLFGNLCHCWQVTPVIRWHWVTVSTKDKDHAGDESLAAAGLVIWNSLRATLRTTTVSHFTFVRHLKADLFG